MRFYLMVLLLLLSTSALATSLDLNLSNRAVRAGLTQPLQANGLEVGGSWLHHIHHGDVFDAALHLVDYPEPGRGSLKLGVGGKLLLIDENHPNVEGVALAIGGKLRYTWPTYNRFGIGGDVYYAPNVTSGWDVDHYFEGALRAEYLILRNANVYVGLRTVRVGDGRHNDTHNFDSGVHLGLRLDF